MIYNLSFSQTFSITQGNPQSNKWIIVWGGMPYKTFGQEYMRDSYKKYFTKENVIWSDYQISMRQLGEFIYRKNPNYKISAVYGFSRGGATAYAQIGKVPFVGLIDPVIPDNYETECSSTTVWMLYNPVVWGKENRAKLKKVAENYKNSIQTDIPHLRIPELFFEKYKFE